MMLILTNRAKKYIARLQDRADILQRQIDNNTLRDYSEHKAELSALVWAVEKLSVDSTNMREDSPRKERHD